MEKASVPSGARPARRPKAETDAIKLLVGVCFAVILLVLLVPGIRRAPFAQGMAGLVMALLVAVVIFALFPPTVDPKVKLPASLLSAAGFFLVLVPKIKPMVFPRGDLVGDVQFEGTSTPVEGATIRLRGSQTDVTTGKNGNFVLTDVRSDATDLEIHYKQFDTTVVVNDAGHYPVVPRFAPASTEPKSVDVARWVESRTAPCTPSVAGARPRRFAIQEPLSMDVEAWKSKRVSDSTFHIKIRPTGGAMISAAGLDQPERTVRLNVESEAPAWHWYVENPPRSVTAQITVCVENVAGTGPAPLVMTYWFEGTERRSGGAP